MQVTIKHPKYQELTNQAIDKRMLELGFYQKYNPNLVKDLANAASFQVWGEDKKSSFVNLDELDLPPEELKYYSNVQTFLENIDFSKFRGGTPLEIAVDVITMLNSQEGGEAKSKPQQQSKPQPKQQSQPQNSENEEDGDDEGEGQGEGNSEKEESKESKGKSKPKPNQQGENEQGQGQGGKGDKNKDKEGEENNNHDPNKEKDVAQRADESATYDFFDSNTSGTIQKTRIMQDSVQQYRKAVESGIADAFHNPAGTPDWLKVSKLSKLDKKVLDNLNIVRNFGKLKTKKANPNKLGKMNDYSQIMRLANITEMALPSFKKKLANKELIVKETEGGKKNGICLLIDDSGSQSEESKQSFIRAVVLHYLEQVMKNNCELIILWYESKVFWDNLVHIKNKKEAQEFIKKNKYGSFNLGGTDIAKCLLDVEDHITKGKLGDVRFEKIDKFQITILLDAQDFIEPTTVLKYPTNAFVLGCDNDNLKTVIERSNGLFKRFF